MKKNMAKMTADIFFISRSSFRKISVSAPDHRSVADLGPNHTLFFCLVKNIFSIYRFPSTYCGRIMILAIDARGTHRKEGISDAR
jgi:hypothetical protein